MGLLKDGWLKYKERVRTGSVSESVLPRTVPIAASQLHSMAIDRHESSVPVAIGFPMCASREAVPTGTATPLQQLRDSADLSARQSCCSRSQRDSDPGPPSDSLRNRLLKESLGATWMVTKFMALAFLLEGLITLYVPQEWIAGLLGSGNPLTIVTAALLGVPAYTTSLTALPMISGLLTQGMSPAAALAFLVAGPVTTLPAMAAVWPLVARRVFALYVSFALVGAVLIGYAFSLVGALLG